MLFKSTAQARATPTTVTWRFIYFIAKQTTIRYGKVYRSAAVWITVFLDLTRTLCTISLWWRVTSAENVRYQIWWHCALKMLRAKSLRDLRHKAINCNNEPASNAKLMFASLKRDLTSHCMPCKQCTQIKVHYCFAMCHHGDTYGIWGALCCLSTAWHAAEWRNIFWHHKLLTDNVILCGFDNVT